MMTPSCAGNWDTGCQGYRGLTRWQFGCTTDGSGSQLQIQYDQYATACGGTSFPHNSTRGFSPGAVYPFTFTLTFTDPFNDIRYTDGYRTLTVSDPDPGQQCCFMYFQVNTSCDGSPQSGATVNVWTDSSKTTLIASGTTDGSGAVDLNLGSHAGSIYYEVTQSRFATASATVTVSCGQYNSIVPRTVNLTAATGYVCVSSCAVPVATTLHATHPKFGAITLTYNASGTFGAGWYTTVTYSYPGCFACPARTVTVTCFLSTSFTYSDHWKSN
jgi:hypothetical protein